MQGAQLLIIAAFTADGKQRDLASCTGSVTDLRCKVTDAAWLFTGFGRR
ncbi:hypothetical protein [Xylella fastidiosa]